jgi:hypothetical protein
MDRSDDPQSDDTPRADRFYAGTIKKLFLGAGMGLVRSATGREIPFAAVHVIVTGAVRRFEDLREGMAVGFDVGWTSKGLRVTVLHISAAGELERQAGAEEQESSEHLSDQDRQDGDVE